MLTVLLNILVCNGAVVWWVLTRLIRCLDVLVLEEAGGYLCLRLRLRPLLLALWLTGTEWRGHPDLGTFLLGPVRRSPWVGRASDLSLLFEAGRHGFTFLEPLPLSDLLCDTLFCPLTGSVCAASLLSLFGSKLWESAFKSGLRLLKSWRTHEGGRLEEVDPWWGK